MVRITVKENEAGQRLDKLLHKLLPLAPASFLHKMLRKKNITLNGKKAEGKEKINQGDQITLFLSEETVLGFKEGPAVKDEYEKAYQTLKGVEVVYEDEHTVILNKPVNLLSQKAGAEDLSVNEWLIGYLLHTGKLQQRELETFKPAVCNRLDRNTSGLVVGACSLAGSQKINSLIKNRDLRKFYQMIVKGRLTDEHVLEGYLIKDEKTNRVRLLREKEEDAAPVRLRLYPVFAGRDLTLAEAELITGKPHQIRAQLADMGHPLLGDYKYGDRAFNEKYRSSHKVRSQLLHACRLEFPRLEAPFEKLSQRTIETACPRVFEQVMKGERR